MITAEQDPETEIRLQDLGAITIIQKPFEIEKITEIIKKIQKKSFSINLSRRNYRTESFVLNTRLKYSDDSTGSSTSFVIPARFFARFFLYPTCICL